MSAHQVKLVSDDKEFICHSIGAVRPSSGNVDPPKVYVVDDEYFSRQVVKNALEDAGWLVEEFATCEDFLSAYKPSSEACLVLDLHFQGMGGLELLERMRELTHVLPTIMMSGSSEISEAVRSMKSGAADFMVKPIHRESLLECVRHALGQSREGSTVDSIHGSAAEHMASLTPRQREIMDLVLAGHPSKNIAADLGISQRTVENHRAAVMHKTGSRSLPELARLAVEAFAVRSQTRPFQQRGPDQDIMSTPIPV